VKVFTGTVTSGVTSFNTRIGSVTSATGDYSFSQLSGKATASQLPSTMTCSFAATVGTTDTATLSNCQ
jgi:hypothetical protein